MNSLLKQLHPYPFEKLRQLFQDVVPPSDLPAISLGMGEPKHATPQFICDAITANLNGLANYPATQGSDALRSVISEWISRRYSIPAPNPATQVLPVNGSREALFAFAQAVINCKTRGNIRPLVMCPNPFYQIYEGATYLARAEPYFVNTNEHFLPDYASVPDSIWQHVQLLFVCSPGNPTGSVLGLNEWKRLFDLSDKYGFVIAADECYSEIYCGDTAPLGSLEAAHQLGRTDFPRLVSFGSLSKRSNVPGMRSGFIAGDAKLIKPFLLYRTYHGSAMNPAIQSASVKAWQDEQHVIENRALYKRKFDLVTPLLQPVLEVNLPDAGFYLWARVNKLVPFTDINFAKQLFAEYNVTVLPGSYLAREAHGTNPGQNYIRMALVASVDDCVEAAHRIVAFIKKRAT